VIPHPHSVKEKKTWVHRFIALGKTPVSSSFRIPPPIRISSSSPPIFTADVFSPVPHFRISLKHGDYGRIFLLCSW
jgi:hypothetical protein